MRVAFTLSTKTMLPRSSLRGPMVFCLHSCLLTFLTIFQKSLLFWVLPNSFFQYRASAVLSWRVTSFLVFLYSLHRSSLCVLLVCCNNLYRLFMHFLIAEVIQGKEFDLILTFLSGICAFMMLLYSVLKAYSTSTMSSKIFKTDHGAFSISR